MRRGRALDTRGYSAIQRVDVSNVCLDIKAGDVVEHEDGSIYIVKQIVDDIVYVATILETTFPIDYLGLKGTWLAKAKRIGTVEL